eukprot:m.142578 g.142578  ORF g.142578 m.142578 type:complete len:507 (-) comp14063_c0_seq1:1811-3331(-)
MAEGVPFKMGKGTQSIPKALHRENRERLVAGMKEAGESGIILLEGGKQTTRHDTDHEDIFRQESYFHWTFGVTEGDWFGAVDIDNNKSILFMPRLPEAYAVWMGEIFKPAYFLEKYAVDEIYYVDEMAEVFSKTYTAATVHVLYGKNSDSGNFAQPASFEGLDSFTVNKDALFPVIAELRVVKTAAELEVLRYVAQISSEAHVAVMREVRPNFCEYNLEAIFLHYIYMYGGCRHTAYTCICACGPSAAVLHYGHAGAPNDQEIKDGQMALLDMGAEYNCFCADITCSYPINGKFTEEQKIVYQGVLNAVIAVEEAMKPGVSWVDMHKLASRKVLEALVKLGCLEGDVDEMMAVHLGGLFMPHGLGHFLGLDTHDVGGYLPGHPDREPHPGLKSLRTSRLLKENMVLTVEPGCYFIDSEMDKAISDPKFSKFVNVDRLNQFRGWGGVRIEDDVLVTADGIDNFTQTPRTIEEVESVMSGGQWPPAEDKAPQLCRSFATWGDRLPKAK